MNQTPSVVQEHQGHIRSYERQEDNNDETDNNDDEEDDNDNTPSFLNEEIHKLERETNAILDLVQHATEETPSSSLLSLSSSLLSQEKKRKNNNKNPTTLATGFDILHDNGDKATTTNWSSSSSTSTPIWEEWKADWDAVEEIAAAEMTTMTCQMDNDEDDDDEDADDNHMGSQCKEFLLS